MKFVSPALLYGFLAIAIPILIHLFNLRKFKKVYFSNVQFLQEIKEETKKQNKLKHLIVLLCRILAIIFIVLAFAQPYFPVSKMSVNQGISYNSIYIDNSFSMELQNEEGKLLDQAKIKGKEIVSAYNDNDKFQVLDNDFSGQSQRFFSKSEALLAIDDIQLSAEQHPIQEILNRQISLWKSVNASNRKSFIVSDFQLNTEANLINQTIDSGISVRFVKLQSQSLENISIDSAWFTKPLYRAAERNELIVRLKNYSDSQIEEVSYSLTINNEQKGIGSINMPANGTVLDTIRFKGNNAGLQFGELKVNDQNIHFDDRYFFTYPIQLSSKLLLIDGNPRTSEYLKQVYNTEKFIDLKSVSYDNINYADLIQFQTIILNEPETISDGFLEELKKFVSSGGYLIIIPSFKTNLLSLNGLLAALNTSTINQLNVTPQRVAQLNYKEETLKEVFSKNSDRMDLPLVNSYFELKPSISESVFKLVNGNNVLVKSKFGKGKVYLFAFPMSLAASNLPKHALMVPLFLRIPQLASTSSKMAYTIGKALAFVSKNNIEQEKSKYVLQNGKDKWVPEVQQSNEGIKLLLSSENKGAGHYILKADEKVIDGFALNYARSESVLKYFTEEQLLNANLPDLKIWKASKQNMFSNINQENFGVRLWKICVILALIFLGLEVIIIRYWNYVFSSNTVKKQII